MATIVDTTLVTLTEFQDWAQDSNRVVETGTDATVLRTLRAAQDAVVKYCERELFVSFVTEDWKPTFWVNIAGTSYPAMFTREYPVVEVPDTGVTINPKNPRTVYATSVPSTNEFTYYAGYKRSDQNLAALNALTVPTVLTSMAGTPDTCPDDLTSAICEAALLMLGRVNQNHVAHGGLSIEPIGVAVTTASRLPRSEARAIFTERIPDYKRISVGLEC